MLIDLHMHSTESDGQYRPSELVHMVLEKNIEIMALTDHDTVSGLEEAALEANKLGITFVPGIEISTMEYEEIHMVGLGIDYRNANLIQMTEELKDGRVNRGTKIKEYMSTLGVDIDLDEVFEIAGQGSIGRPHFAEYLKRHKYVASRQEAFKRYLDTPSFHEATDRKLPSPEQAIELIHEAGGEAILAHPGLLKKGKAKQAILFEKLKSAGLDGIEVFYSKHSYPQTKYYTAIAEQYGFKMSIGSDFHGEQVKPEVKLGMQLNKKYYGNLPQNVVSLFL